MNREALIKESKELLTKLKFQTDSICKVLDNSLEQKTNLRTLFSRHPQWVDDKDYIVLDKTSYHRVADKVEISCFYDWVYNEVHRNNWGGDFRHPLDILRFSDFQNQFLTKSAANCLNDEITRATERGRDDIRFRPQEGQKTSKAVQKFIKIFAPELLEIKRMETIEWTDGNTGELHSRQRDMGWAHRWTLYADAINPLDIITYTVISLNPIDFWLMSNGDSWRSCHTPDPNGILGNPDPTHSYSGQYMGGTESYMGDDSSFIVYTVSSKYDGTDYELQPKGRRCVFALNKNFDILLQSRVYPDGRDGGEASVAGQMRAIVQRVVADCLGVDNSWKLSSDPAYDYTVSYGVHYRDYEEYDDCNVSFLKVNGKVKAEETGLRSIYIGSDPICPCCGNRHENRESLLCFDCADKVECEHCGEMISRRDAIEVDDGVYYCDEECAERDGWCRVVNTDYGWTQEAVYYDEHTGENFEWECDSVELDGNYYMNEYNARQDGWIYVSDGRWVHEDNLVEENENM